MNTDRKRRSARDLELICTLPQQRFSLVVKGREPVRACQVAARKAEHVSPLAPAHTSWISTPSRLLLACSLSAVRAIFITQPRDMPRVTKGEEGDARDTERKIPPVNDPILNLVKPLVALLHHLCDPHTDVRFAYAKRCFSQDEASTFELRLHCRDSVSVSVSTRTFFLVSGFAA